jgi:hypothetical protein
VRSRIAKVPVTIQVVLNILLLLNIVKRLEWWPVAS